jgi:hypothetical protein
MRNCLKALLVHVWFPHRRDRVALSRFALGKMTLSKKLFLEFVNDILHGALAVV